VFIFIAIAVFIFGLLFGSFSNVLIYRIPRGESIVFPPSHCPKCGARIKPYDNIPIISYIMLGGRCRSCHQPISIRYPLVELSVGLIFLLNFLLFGFSVNFARFLLFMYSLFLLSATDILYMVIPDKISIPALILGLIINLFHHMPIKLYIINFIIGTASGMIVIWLIMVIGKIIWKKEVMGSGDIFVMGIVGAYLGIYYILPTLFWGALFGAVYGIVLIVRKKASRDSMIPFGPFLAAGAITSLLTLPFIFKLLGL